MPTLEEALIRKRGQNGIASANPWSTPEAQANPLSTSKIGALDSVQLRDNQWGTGDTFITNANQGGFDALRKSFSSANPEDIGAMNAVRDAWGGQLSRINEREDLRKGAAGTDSQRTLSGLLSQFKNANAGTGRMGTRGYNNQQGDILSKVAADYTRQLNDIEGQSIQDLGNVQQGLSGVYNQGLQERGFQNQQAQSLADYLMGQQKLQLGRAQGLDSLAQQKDEAKQNFWASIISSAAQGAGKMAGAK